MATTYWYHNAKTGEIDSYEESGGLTNFPRGTFLAYSDYITTGLASKEEAEQWAAAWSACYKCKSARHGQPGTACVFCGDILQAPTR